MNIQPYRILLGAALMVLAGTVGAQTAEQPKPNNTGDDATAQTAQLPPSRPDMAKAPTQASQQASAKMDEQSDAQAQASEKPSTKMKTGKRAHHLAKRAGSEDKVASEGESAYRQALRQCAEEKNSDQRDGCLDNAIEQFHRNT